MAVFKICVRKANKNGMWPVYIRVANNYHLGYIKTSWLVDKHGLSRKGEVKDPFVLESCSKTVSDYIRRLNGLDTSAWNFARLKKFLAGEDSEVSFSAFARKHIDRLEQLGHDGNARLYKASLKSFERFMESESVRFSEMTRDKIEEWITKLGTTRRAKSLYAVCLRVIFNAAMAASMDPASTLPSLKYNPWSSISIPESASADKRSISVEDCRRFLSAEIPQGKGAWPKRIGRDMALLSFCLAGMNTVDLFNLRKDDYKNGVLGYKRAKTKTRRKDGAYFEIKVNDVAAEIIEKYKAPEGSELLLNFGERYHDARSFNAMVNRGIKSVCTDILGMKESDANAYSYYSFRHTWATIARNVCGATLSEVGFAMNHLQSDAVTRGYIDIDFSPAWELNEKVYATVFGNPKEMQKPVKAQEEKPARGNSSIENVVSADCMVYVRVYFRGQVLQEHCDIGFKNTEDVLRKLMKSVPDDVPNGVALHFRIKNVDTGEEIVVQRNKGTA